MFKSERSSELAERVIDSSKVGSQTRSVNILDLYEEIKNRGNAFELLDSECMRLQVPLEKVCDTLDPIVKTKSV